jgi:Zn finger protein HypA/HybF involved in hydrogenase expression
MPTAEGQDPPLPSAVPENVRIDALAAEYAPVNFPHGKIVRTLTAKQSAGVLGRTFHTESSLCVTCHHGDTRLDTITPCISCHGTDDKVAYPDGRPGLKAAYHIQCMACHEAVKQEPRDIQCDGCHQPSVK